MSAHWSLHHRLRSLAAVGVGLTVFFFFALDTSAALAATPPMRASDWKSIKQVIAAQRAALIAGEGAKAFGYATPAIRAQFGEADIFMAMVQVGYPALLTARYTEFLEGAVIDGLIIQPLRLVDADNSVRVALYTMEKQKTGAWRISGCRIGPSTIQAAEWINEGRPQRRSSMSPLRAIRSTASSKRLA
ncbi:MAG TPA: DUF4864 domain-containing protein [Casimicrobiaceae bacterium]|nr:DUF4864 domain-containing protein [Casimicrobiaceae bacterium]